MNIPNVLFLDFDGPLYPKSVHTFPENINPEYDLIHPFISYWKMDPIAVAFLNELHNVKPFETVLSTSWCSLVPEEDAYVRLFEANGLKLKFHKNWMTPRISWSRGDQIIDWIKANNPADYIILDDNESGDGLLGSPFIDQSRIFMVDMNNGILYDDYQKLLNIIKVWQYGPAYDPIDNVASR